MDSENVDESNESLVLMDQDSNGPKKWIEGGLYFADPPSIMSTISWNCCGLGNPRASQFLEDLVLQKKPKFVFVCETICKKDVIERLKFRLGFEACFSVDPVGRKGGLALFWKVKEEACLLGYSNNHIDVEISLEGTTKWRLTGLYGEPNRAFRHQTWALVRTLRRNSHLPWCVIGDINNIGSVNEQKGGRPYPNYLINGFQEMLSE
uniref:Endonuclease/exonuclease/phosphatase domain-containing protein n=1 Tax=Cannabis sativa TaxID=3483 RepID=A0A803R261_CANSA